MRFGGGSGALGSSCLIVAEEQRQAVGRLAK